MTELIVVSRRDFHPLLVGEIDQRLCFLRIEGKRLLDVHVSSRVDAELGKVKMALRRRRNVNHIRMTFAQECPKIRVAGFHRISLIELARHQRFAVTYADDFATANPLDLRGMGIGNLAAPDNGNFKHEPLFPCMLRSSASILLRSKSPDAIRVSSSASDLCSGSSSRTNSIGCG